ncbi:DsbA family protein [Patescibacteria group bacterium]|nr:DsbA family protein [Patescibacteria group bacterium]
MTIKKLSAKDRVKNLFSKLGDTSKYTTTILLALVVGGSFYIGVLTTELKMYKSGGALPSNAAPVNAAANGAVPTVTQEQLAKVLKPTKTDHVRGSQNPKVVLVEYSDYECPFCARFHPSAKQALEEFGSDFAWVYRHFPLTSIHPKAMPLAIASECVFNMSDDATYWKFSDIMFEKGSALQVADLEGIVSNDLGLNGAKFTECLNAKETQAKVTDQQKAGSSIGVSGTPGNFLINLENNKVVTLRGAVPYETLQTEIKGLLGK